MDHTKGKAKSRVDGMSMRAGFPVEPFLRGTEEVHRGT
jgi:hypothetical protein